MMHPRKMKYLNESGFTLLELMIVGVLLAVGASVTAWSVNQIMPEMRLKQAIRDLRSDIQVTRLRSIRENTPITFLFDTVNNNYTIFYDDGAGGGTAADWAVNGGEQVIEQVDMPMQVTLSDVDFPDDGSDQARVRFDRLGIPSDSGRVVMADTLNNTRSIVCNMVAQIQVQAGAGAGAGGGGGGGAAGP